MPDRRLPCVAREAVRAVSEKGLVVPVVILDDLRLASAGVENSVALMAELSGYGLLADSEPATCGMLLRQ